MAKFLIFTNNATFHQEAGTPKEAIERFIGRIKQRASENRTKIPIDREISFTLTEALENEALMLIVVAADTEHPRKLLGGYCRNRFVDVVDQELAKAVRRKLTDEEFRSVCV
jgi:hypothetical protein